MYITATPGWRTESRAKSSGGCFHPIRGAVPTMDSRKARVDLVCLPDADGVSRSNRQPGQVDPTLGGGP